MKNGNDLQRYYKVVGYGFPFTCFIKKHYNITNFESIPCGAQFSATEKAKGRLPIKAEMPIIHFSDSAFDAILWKLIFKTKSSVIYEIEPQGQVFKQRCNDQYGIYQCGAKEIKIVRTISDRKMLSMAMEEYLKNKKEILEMYPNIKIKTVIRAWMFQNLH